MVASVNSVNSVSQSRNPCISNFETLIFNVCNLIYKEYINFIRVNESCVIGVFDYYGMYETSTLFVTCLCVQCAKVGIFRFLDK